MHAVQHVVDTLDDVQCWWQRSYTTSFPKKSSCTTIGASTALHMSVMDRWARVYAMSFTAADLTTLHSNAVPCASFICYHKPCSAANSYSQKMYNWSTLNSKVRSLRSARMLQLVQTFPLAAVNNVVWLLVPRMSACRYVCMLTCM
jgi:hypothetical protein